MTEEIEQLLFTAKR